MPGLRAPARRLGIFANTDTSLVLADAGWALFDAAVPWTGARDAETRGARRRDLCALDRIETVEKDTKKHLGVEPDVIRALGRETRRFLTDAFADGGSKRRRSRGHKTT